MFQENLLQRANLLYSQRRYAEAEKEFGLLLVSQPSNSRIHCMIALCKLETGKKGEASQYVMNAIGLDPSESFCFYVGAVVEFRIENYKAADKLIDTAISLNPSEADYFEIKSLIALNNKEWSLALEYANKGLSIEAEHIGCLNCRATSLVKLDKKGDAYDTIDEALHFDPKNSHTHANLGWGLLEKNDHNKSLHHFRQALMLNPNNEYAKSGLVEALKARYWIYRIFLRYAFWIGNMKSGAQWGVMIGFYVGSRILNVISNNYPSSRVVTIPLIILYMLFALTTWIIRPLSNLFLRLNVYGKYALSKEEIMCSNIIGISLLLSALSGIAFLFFDETLLLMLCILFFTLTIPVSGTFAARRETKGRKILTFYTIGMLAVGLLSLLMFTLGEDVYNTYTTIYLLGFIAFQWIANAVIMR